MNVSNKTVRTAEIPFSSFKILAGDRSLWSYLEDLYWRCWCNTLLTDTRYEALISLLFSAFVFVENPVVPLGVFVFLFRVNSMTLSVSKRLNFPTLLNCLAKFPETNSCYVSEKSFTGDISKHRCQILSVVNIVVWKSKWNDFTNAT